VVHHFVSEDYFKDPITLEVDDVVDVAPPSHPTISHNHLPLHCYKVISWASVGEGADNKLMFKHKGRVGTIPSSYLSGQVRLSGTGQQLG